MLQTIDRWHKTRIGYLISGLAELGVAYYFASLAIDRGSWWWYLLTLVLLVGALQNFAKLIGTFIHGRTR